MTYLTHRILQKPIWRSQFLRWALSSLVLIALQAVSADAQWTNDRNIKHRNTSGIKIAIDNSEETLDRPGATRPRGYSRFDNQRMLVSARPLAPCVNVKPNPVAKGLMGVNATSQPLTATLNRIAKWIDNAGTLGDSAISESDGLSVFGQTTPLFPTASSYHVAEIIAPGGKTPLVLAGGNGSMEFWKDLGNNPGGLQAAAAFGMAKPGTTATNDMVFSTYNVGGWFERLRITNGGNVGIGTSNPAAKLQISGMNPRLRLDGDVNSYYPGIEFYGLGGTHNIGSFMGYAQTGMIYTFDKHWFRNTANADLMVIESSGKVGIGTLTPATQLHVVGDVTVTGNIAAKYQDVAEWVPASERFPAGTVVVLDSTKSNHVIASNKSYDTRVAGVISEQPGITLGERGDNKVLVATTGRVRLKVDASSGPIQVGDLLVTSDIPGMAMKSQAINVGGVQLHRPGTLLGKALEPLTKGKGEILVLLSLQ
jgi:hypothetical protein